MEVLGQQLTSNDNDWLGIHATRLNAQLIRTIFQEIADPRIIKHYEVILKIDKPVAIAAGWKPGWSTDYCAVTLCQDYNIPQVINLTNIDHVYTKTLEPIRTQNPYKILRGKNIERWLATIGYRE